MYTLLLVGCILAIVLCPLLLDAILTWKETQPERKTARRATGLALVSPHLH